MKKQRQIKRMISLVLVFMLCIYNLNLTTRAVTYTTLNLSTLSADLTITPTSNGGVPYLLTGSTTTYKITISGGAVTLGLSNATINMLSQSSKSAITVSSGSTLNLDLQGTSYLYGSSYYAGINVPSGATLNISGSGTLRAYGGDAGDGRTMPPSRPNALGGGGGGYPAAGIGGGGGSGGAGSDYYNDLDCYGGSGAGAGIGGSGGVASWKTANPGEGAGNISIGSTVTVLAVGGGGGSGGSGNNGNNASWGGVGGGGGFSGGGGGVGQGTIGSGGTNGYAGGNASGTFPATGGGGYYSGGGNPGSGGCAGGNGGSGGTVKIIFPANVTAQNGSKGTTSTSQAQGWLAVNSCSITGQSTQGYGTGAGRVAASNGTLTVITKSYMSYNGNGATSGSMADQEIGVNDSVTSNLTTNAYSRAYTVTYNYNGSGAANTSATATATFNGWEDRGKITGSDGKVYNYTDYDAPYYAICNGDVFQIVGKNVYNKYAILGHYITAGKGEGRNPKDPNGKPGLYPNNAPVTNMATEAGYTVPLFANWTLGSTTLPTPTRTNYTFGGWYSESACTTFVGNGGTSYTPSASATLYAKWTGIAPTITTQPVSQVVTPNTNVTVTVGAANATGYQWYKKGTAISGATSASYSFTSSEADNGATFYCIVSGTGGTVTTSTATLTVYGTPQTPSLIVPTESWTNSNVTATILGGTVPSGGQKLQYSTDGSTWTDYASELLYSTDIKITLYARAINSQAANLISGTVSKAIKVDKTAPTISSVTATAGNANSKIITVDATDSGSGIAQYYLSTSSASQENGAWQNGSTFPVTTNGTWYVFVKDTVGNVSAAHSVTASGTYEKVASATLTYPDNNVIYSGRSANPTLAIVPNGTLYSKVTYVSSDNAIVAVNGDTGSVTGIGVGTATITATITNFDATTIVASQAVTVSPDVTAPELTAGVVKRISVTAGTAKFTSNEEGTYYYNLGSAPDTSGVGTACGTSENIISLTNLTGDAAELYIIVKDAAGNASSDSFKVSIPGYAVNVDTNGDGKADVNIDSNGDGTADLNIDTNGDGKPDVNIDTNGDGTADVNMDTNDDGKPDVNIDTNGDGKPDVNLDTNGDGKSDVNLDTNGDGKADVNLDTNGDGTADVNIDRNDDGKPDVNLDTNGDGKPDVNVDTNGDGTADVNIDTNGDGKADVNIDTNGDGKADVKVDSNNDGKVDVNIDTNGDGKADVNVDKDGDGIADVNVDSNGDGKADVNLDTNGDGTADVNIDTNGDGTADVNLDTNGDGKADVNVDTNGDGTPDLNVDTNSDGMADINIDTNGDGTADVNVDTDGDGIADSNLSNTTGVNLDTNGDGTPDVNVDTNSDGKADLNIDTNGDGKADVNVDTNGDGTADVNVDTNKDGKADVNLDTNGDGTADVNQDTNSDGKADVNIDTNGDGKPDVNVDTNGDGTADVNVDTNGDGTADVNVDTNGDGTADVNVDANKDGTADINVDTNGDGKADMNVDTNGDGTADVNVDTNGDGKADVNIDTNGDGTADVNVDTNGDGKADENLDTNGDGKPDININTPTFTILGSASHPNLRLVDYTAGGETYQLIRGLNPLLEKASQTKSCFQVSNGTAKWYKYSNGSNIEVPDTDATSIFGGASKVEVYNNIGTLMQTYYFVIKGDVNGDGKINAFDTMAVKSHVAKSTLIKDNFLINSADITGDGKVNAFDTMAVKNHVAKQKIISQ